MCTYVCTVYVRYYQQGNYNIYDRTCCIYCSGQPLFLLLKLSCGFLPLSFYITFLFSPAPC